MAERCSILYINADGFADTQSNALRSLGFDVVEVDNVPSQETLVVHHAILVRIANGSGLTTVSNRLRAVPQFGRRVLIALVPSSVTARERRDAVHSGFNLVLPQQCSARDLAASILSLLRKYPEHRCVLRAHSNRRRAA
jgi:hypothetical protein